MNTEISISMKVLLTASWTIACLSGSIIREIDLPFFSLGSQLKSRLANAIFLELGLVGICEKMKAKGQELYINRDRGILIALLDKSQISQKKADTALYRVAGGAYSEMALANDFSYNDASDIKSRSLKEFRLLCTVGEISIYKHKSDRKYYVSEHRTGTAPEYKSDEVGLKRYQKKHGLQLFSAYMRGNVTFENMLTKSLFELYTV